MSNSQQIAKTTFSQLGGNRFAAMTGSKQFVHGNDENGNAFLQFKVGRNSRLINRVKITLTEMDDYNMEFQRVSTSRKTFETTVKTISEREGVYCDELSHVFTMNTGLYTSL